MPTTLPLSLYFSSLLRNSHHPCALIKQIHVQILTHGFNSNFTLQTDLLLSYSKSRLFEYARNVFDKMSHKNMHSWNILIASYVDNSLFHDALNIFGGFYKDGFRPDHYTLPPLFRGCTGIKDSNLGKVFHGFVICLGFEHYVVVGSSILDFYIKCDHLVDSRRFFESMCYKDNVVWNTMIAGLGRFGVFGDALIYLKKMIGGGVEIDSMTIPSVLNACGGLGDLIKGKEVHGKVIRSLNLYNRDVVIENSLIDMYAKCGCLPYSEKVFMKMGVTNVVTWTTMISCYGLHGKGGECLYLFKKMRENGFKPNSVTITALLASCGHSGLLDQGRRIFDSVCLEYGIEHSVEHYACMVNLLGRFGFLEEAFHLITNMKLNVTASVWGALLACCVMQKNVEIGEIAANHLFDLEPMTASNHIALCSIYESRGICQGVSKIKARMRELGLVKTPGCSWIIIEGREHKFYQGDFLHISNPMILDSLDRITKILVLNEDFG